MALEHHVGRILNGVEVVDEDLVLGCTCEEVTSVGELDFIAVLGGNGLGEGNFVAQNVADRDLVPECHDQVQSAWMECNS